MAKTHKKDKAASHPTCKPQMATHHISSNKKSQESLDMVLLVRILNYAMLLGLNCLLGKRLDVFCKALGMKVLIAERKADGPSQRNPNDIINGPAGFRTPFDEVIRSATMLFICCTLDEASRNMVDAPELSAMQPEAIIVNVSRRGHEHNCSDPGITREADLWRRSGCIR